MKYLFFSAHKSRVVVAKTEFLQQSLYIVIQRIGYLERLVRWREKPPVKVLSGIRGCGKTTLLAMYIDWLKRSGVDDSQIIYINLEDPGNEALLHYRGLYSRIAKQLCRQKCTYIFIDEIQRCDGYEKAVKGLLQKQNVDIYTAVSGNAEFSGGNNITIQVLPLSFAEYLLFIKARRGGLDIPAMTEGIPITASPANEPKKIGQRLPRKKAALDRFYKREAFTNYLGLGGFPFAAIFYEEPDLSRRCAEGIYSTALLKDAACLPGINDIPLLEQVVKLMCRTEGKPVSSTKIAAAAGGNGRRLSSNTVETYMRALTAAGLFFRASRLDLKTGKKLKTLGRYYIADSGIQNTLLESASADTGVQIENIVYLELLRRGYDVYIGKYGGDEVNFAAFPSSSSGNKEAYPLYIQIAVSVRSGNILSGKLAPLSQCGQEGCRYVLSLDEIPFPVNRGGVMQMNIIDWLTEHAE